MMMLVMKLLHLKRMQEMFPSEDHFISMTVLTKIYLGILTTKGSRLCAITSSTHARERIENHSKAADLHNKVIECRS